MSSSKIVIVGPPGVGKTTLRKVFFEGENSKDLLEHSLKPTHGQESIILKLGEIGDDLGIFDLAGQENRRWLESEKSIFKNSRILLVVIDVTIPIDKIIEFCKTIIKLRNEITPSAYIYILVHKIDLVDQRELMDIKKRINIAFVRKNRIKIAFTSIEKDYFSATFSLFIDILRTCISEETPLEKIDLTLLKNTVDFLYCLRQEDVISQKQLKDKLSISESDLEEIISNLQNKDHIEIRLIDNNSIYSLTNDGKQYLEGLLKDFSKEGIKDTRIELKTIQMPPFLGFLLADKDGKLLMPIEESEGIFRLFLADEDDEMRDFDLIPMLISALEIFSSELNIKNISGFQLKGTNIQIQTINLEYFQVTFILSAYTNLESVRHEIVNWFNKLFKDYKRDFEASVRTGVVSRISELEPICIKWLRKLNESYRKKAIDLEIYDRKQAEVLYNRLDEITTDLNVKYSILLEKIKKSKVSLMKAILEENFEEIREIAKKIQDIKSFT